jgi:hypothetical protein
MGIFGWNYPPGCNGPPGDEAGPCAICGKHEHICICPECPQCGSVGDPACYKSHGMMKSPEQIESLAQAERGWQEMASHDASADQAYADELIRDLDVFDL